MAFLAAGFVGCRTSVVRPVAGSRLRNSGESPNGTEARAMSCCWDSELWGGLAGVPPRPVAPRVEPPPSPVFSPEPNPKPVEEPPRVLLPNIGVEPNRLPGLALELPNRFDWPIPRERPVPNPVLVVGVGPNEKPPAGLLNVFPKSELAWVVAGAPKVVPLNAVVPVDDVPKAGVVPKPGVAVLAPNRFVPAVVVVFWPKVNPEELFEPRLKPGLFWLNKLPVFCCWNVHANTQLRHINTRTKCM